jgi:hypothetical protein
MVKYWDNLWLVFSFQDGPLQRGVCIWCDPNMCFGVFSSAQDGHVQGSVYIW